MKQSSGCVIVGASHAAAQLVVQLRQGGWQKPIDVVSDEFYLPYQRPTLSKSFLSEGKLSDQILIRPQSAYKKLGVRFHLGVRVTKLNLEEMRVDLSGGGELEFEKLVLTTGAKARALTVPGSELQGIYYLRSIDDAKGIRAKISAGKKVVIIGGGYIGLEAAASLKSCGMDVTVLEAMDRVLQRVTSPAVSEFYSRVHSEEGVRIKTGVEVTAIEGSKKVEKVILAGGDFLEADVVIVGIGVIPNIQLAEEAGLEVANGIVVNEFCQTSNENVFSAGDCSCHFSELYQKSIRLESVQNAVDQATTIASVLNQKPVPYQSVPWFWSDQYDLKLQIAGLSGGYDEMAVRGDIVSSRSFCAFYLLEGRLIAVDAVNSPQNFLVSKRLIAQRSIVSKDQLEDPDYDLKKMLST